MTDTSERNQRIYERRMNGETFQSIANDLGVTVERIRQICVKHAREIRFLENHPKRSGQDITLDLSIYSVFDKKIARPLRGVGILTLADIVKMIEDDGLYRAGRESYLPRKIKVENLGNGGWQKILHALSVAGFEWRKHVNKATPTEQ